jgi:hypothetical protein
MGMRTSIAVMALLLLGCQREQWDDCITSTGSMTNEERSVPPYHTIELDDRIDLVLLPSSQGLITVTAGRNLLGQVRTEVEDGVLRISNENTCNWVRSFKPRITVRTPAQGLERLVLRGTGNVSCVDTVRAASLAIEQWGAQGTTDLRVAVDHIEVGLHTGAGDVVLRGRCDGEARLYSGIMGPIDASALRAARVAVNNSGITDIRCWAEEELQVHIGDAGDVYFRGDPPAIVTDIQGSGRLLRLP